MMVTLAIEVPFVLVFLALEAYLAHWLALVPLVRFPPCSCYLAWQQGHAIATN